MNKFWKVWSKVKRWFEVLNAVWLVVQIIVGIIALVALIF